jgi:hypothetical protein
MSLATQITAGFQRVGQEIKTVKTALSVYQPTASTRRSEWVFGGCDGIGPCGYTSQSQRIRSINNIQPTRMRLHLRNNQGSIDNAPTGTGPTVRSVYIGPQDMSSTANLWNMTKVDTVFSGTGTAVNGLTEFVSGWYVPTYDLTKQPNLTTVGFTTPATTTNIAINNASHSILIDDYTKANTLNVGTVTGSESATSWYDYQFAQMEIWWEYDYQDDAALVGMVIGHSLPDGVSYAGGSTPGWDGQNTGWPQQHARNKHHSVIVNCYAGNTTASWGNSSPKWNRFNDANVDYAIIHLLENDIGNSSVTASSTTAQITAAAATIDTNLRGMVAKIGTVWATTQPIVYVTIPVGGKPQDTNTGHELLRQQVIANLQAMYQSGLIEGLINFEGAVQTPGDYTTIDSRCLDGNATVSNKHFSPWGHSRLAAAVSVSGTRNSALSPARGPMTFAAAITGYTFPQGVVAVSGGSYWTTGTVTYTPFTVGPGLQTVDAVGFNVGTAYSATATTLQVGLYASGPDGMPNLTSLVAQTSTLSLNAIAVGGKVMTFTAPAALQPGTYWIASVLSGTTATAGSINSITSNAWSLPQASFSQTPAKCLTSSGSTLPTTAQTLSPGVGVTPYFGLRRSA